jgi:hypothetical protein
MLSFIQDTLYLDLLLMKMVSRTPDISAADGHSAPWEKSAIWASRSSTPDLQLFPLAGRAWLYI